MPCSATSLSPFLKTDGFKFFAAHFLCVFCFSAASCVSLLSGAMSCRGAVPFCLPIWGSGPMSLLPPEASFFYTPSVATTAYFLFWFVYLLRSYEFVLLSQISNLWLLRGLFLGGGVGILWILGGRLLRSVSTRRRGCAGMKASMRNNMRNNRMAQPYVF